MRLSLFWTKTLRLQNLCSSFGMSRQRFWGRSRIARRWRRDLFRVSGRAPYRRGQCLSSQCLNHKFHCWRCRGWRLGCFGCYCGTLGTTYWIHLGRSFTPDRRSSSPSTHLQLWPSIDWGQTYHIRFLQLAQRSTHHLFCDWLDFVSQLSYWYQHSFHSRALATTCLLTPLPFPFCVQFPYFQFETNDVGTAPSTFLFADSDLWVGLPNLRRLCAFLPVLPWTAILGSNSSPTDQALTFWVCFDIQQVDFAVELFLSKVHYFRHHNLNSTDSLTSRKPRSASLGSHS